MSGANGVGSTVALSGPRKTLRIRVVDDDDRDVSINDREYFTAITAAWAGAASKMLLEELRRAALPEAIARVTFRSIVGYAQQELTRGLREQAWEAPGVQSIFPRRKAPPVPAIPLYEVVESVPVRDAKGQIEKVVTTKRRTDDPSTGVQFGFTKR